MNQRPAISRWNLLGCIFLGSAHRNCGPEGATPASQVESRLCFMVGHGEASGIYHSNRNQTTSSCYNLYTIGLMILTHIWCPVLEDEKEIKVPPGVHWGLHSHVPMTHLFSQGLGRERDGEGEERGGDGERVRGKKLLVLLYMFWDRVLVCSLGWLWTCHPPSSVCQVLKL